MQSADARVLVWWLLMLLVIALWIWSEQKWRLK